ncbi:MAG: DNA methyltransferase, partial [Elainellaceae cyanobacterium]
MSTARHHAEWLSLVEASGPFLSLQVLMDAFPQGLEVHDAAQFKVLRQAYEEWLDNRDTPSIHRAWVEWVLSEVLVFPETVLVTGQGMPTNLHVTITEHQVTLRPDWAVIDPTTKQPRLLIQVMPPDQGLEKTLKGSRWKASPATGMMELLHATDVRLGLLTNGEQWMLVNAPKGESTGYISWYGNLWLDEKLTLRAFCSLLGVRRFFAVDAGETLEDLLGRSKDAQQEVTDQLGFQVRKAVEVLVQSLDRIDQDRQRTLLSGLPETVLYQAALTVMMRLVFLFSAEERELLLLGDPLYDQFYAVSTLRSQLRELADQHGEELLERRYDAWARLLAIFRGVFGGIHHDALQLPAYGGTLFDPDRFPFLEGRALETHWLETKAEPIPINNRTVLHLLEALQILQIKVPGGGAEPRKLSFRALDIEQIGHVYEGLLDHTAVRATGTILGLTGTKNKEPEVALSDLEQLQEKGEGDLMTFLRKETGRSKSALKKALPDEVDSDNRIDWASLEMQQLRIACNNDQALFDRVLPWAKLIRVDTFDSPIVIPEGSVFVTQGTDRRETGTHYTPKSLTEEIVKYTLEPLVYEGVAEGRPKDDWQRVSAAALLRLKVCDMAMGSGAFLVQVCRYLSERLVEAWEEAERQHPGQIVVAPEGTLSDSRPEECPIPKDADERLAVARRIVADRCLYGVDKNPMAVEMAKLSLWLITLQKNRPFTFLDHALRCGDSLLGVTSREQIEFLHLNPDKEAVQLRTVSDIWRPLLAEAITKRNELESFTVNDIQDLARKEALQAEAEALTCNIKIAADYLIGEALAQAGKTGNRKVEDLGVLSGLVTDALEEPDERERENKLRQIREKAQRMLDAGKPEGQPTREPFHWALEFPEVFLEEDAPKGFSAIVGNPPFQGGKKITGTVGTDYREFLVEYLARGTKGVADLCTYFFLNAGALVTQEGNFGLVATNTIAQGDTREVGLDQLVAQGYTIPRAVPTRPWPGTAALEVAYVWLHKGEWQQKFVLNDNPVKGITAYLTVPGKAVGNPYRLVANGGKSFQGSVVLGMGFVLEPEEAQALIEKNPTNKDVLFPYLNGQDLNSNPDQSPSRWVINFKDWPLDAEHDDPKKPKGAPYAADYPEYLKIVREKVKPQRDSVKKKPYREKWWQFAERCPGLYEAIAECDRVLAICLVTQYFSPAFCPPNWVYAHRLCVFPFESWKEYALIQSNIHETWARQHSSSLETRLNYSPSDCFETFPFPDRTDTLETIGETYYTHRQTIMQTRQEGLTNTYNPFHDPTYTDPDFQTLRHLHIQMDTAVAAAYGWHDLTLDHDFHD